ncbi:hypothetical protein TNCV_3803011 [Trichonephila clavipes]|nr:hypothetical protein TNCV_3803011 [Trichonephila clavipes]
MTAPDALQPERPTKSCLVKNLVNSYRRMSIRMIADELNIPQSQVFEIVTATLVMRKVFRVEEYLAQHNVATLPHPSTAPTWSHQTFF